MYQKILGQMKQDLKFKAESKADEFIDFSCFTKSDQHLLETFEDVLGQASLDSQTDLKTVSGVDRREQLLSFQQNLDDETKKMIKLEYQKS